MENENIFEEESEIDFNILNMIETNQMNMQVNTIKSNDEIKSIKCLNLSENKSLRFSPNDRNNEIEGIVPYIGKKRFRKIFRARKKKKAVHYEIKMNFIY